eukprot:216291-Rhodomonas_salina.1
MHRLRYLHEQCALEEPEGQHSRWELALFLHLQVCRRGRQQCGSVQRQDHRVAGLLGGEHAMVPPGQH